MKTDFSCFASEDAPNHNTIYLQVDGMYCAACAWKIESALGALPNVKARINYSTERLRVTWEGAKEKANEFAAVVVKLGYKVAPFDSEARNRKGKEEEKFLLRCLAASGFASGNIMLFSFALWFSPEETMGEYTKSLMHWIMALIALPTVVYAGRPFFYSAWNALRSFRTNMDVPISLAILLASGMSLYETIMHGKYVYFDACVMLLFFLLTGRYLDKKARGKARDAAESLLSMMDGTATIMENGKLQNVLIRNIKPDMRLLVAAGEKIAADGKIASGETQLDTSLVTGETMPKEVKAGDSVYAGTINIAVPIEVQVHAAGDKTMLSDIVELMEKAEQGQARYVRIADRAAALYTPAVHALALATLLGWIFLMQSPWQIALMNATAVLIITCPCALALAVPVVQVLASGKLFKGGMLLKSGDALERLAEVDTIIFDKTGTLTAGIPTLINRESIEESTLRLAASLAARSNHPLAKALTAAWDRELLSLAAREIPGHGMEAEYDGKIIRLGKRSWCGNETAMADDLLELWLDDGAMKHRFIFSDLLRGDAAETIDELKTAGYEVILLSGDRDSVAAKTAGQAGIKEYHGEFSPIQKTEFIETKIKSGHKVLMVGDGLNDAPALSGATVSMSPATGMDITQNTADIVFRGNSLSPITTAINTAKKANSLVKQNLAISLIYNMLAVPLAVIGLVTPLIAAIAMSNSSLLVIGNSFKIRKEQ